MQLAIAFLLSFLFASALALSNTDQVDKNGVSDESLTPALQGTHDRECFVSTPDNIPLDEAACQKTFRQIFGTRKLDVFTTWGPHFHWAHWQATEGDCAVYLRTRDYYKGKDVFRLRDVVNAAIRITQTCSRVGFGGRAAVGENGYFYVEIRTIRLSSVLDPWISSNGSSMNLSDQKSTNMSNSSVSLPALALTDPLRGVQCKESGSGHISNRACAASVQLIRMEEEFFTYKQWGPPFRTMIWQARGSLCTITLSAQDPIHGTDSFNLSAIRYMSENIVRICAHSGLGYGGTGQVGTHSRFTVFVDGLPSSAPINVATSQGSSSVELQRSSNVSERLPSGSVARRKPRILPRHSGSSAGAFMERRRLLNKTMNVDCVRQPGLPPVDVNSCRTALQALEDDVHRWGSQRSTWRVNGVLRLKKRWNGSPSSPYPCNIALRGGFKGTSIDRLSYADILNAVRKILEVCGASGGRATVGEERSFQAVISRDPRLGFADDDDSSVLSTSLSSQMTSSSSELLPVPTAVENDIRIIKAASMLTFNSNQLTLGFICNSAAAADADAPRLDSSSCAASLALVASIPASSGTQQLGPRFQTRSWQEPGSQCAIFLLSSDESNESKFSMQDVADSATDILLHCGRNGLGGVARVGGASSGFFVGVAAGPAVSSGPLGSINLTAPNLGIGINALSSSASVSTPSSGPIVSGVNIPILPGGGLNVISTAPAIVRTSDSASASAPAQTEIGDNTS